MVGVVQGVATREVRLVVTWVATRVVVRLVESRQRRIYLGTHLEHRRLHSETLTNDR